MFTTECLSDRWSLATMTSVQINSYQVSCRCVLETFFIPWPIKLAYYLSNFSHNKSALTFTARLIFYFIVIISKHKILSDYGSVTAVFLFISPVNSSFICKYVSVLMAAFSFLSKFLIHLWSEAKNHVRKQEVLPKSNHEFDWEMVQKAIQLGWVFLFIFSLFMDLFF